MYSKGRVVIGASEEPIPLVVVNGFLGCAGTALWGNFGASLDVDGENGTRRTRKVFSGPVSSLRHRVCELCYSLLGVTAPSVDYGDVHARTQNHLRHGRTIQDALYPEWSVNRPLHFLGHSMACRGGPTVVKMQWLMRIGFFGEHVHRTSRHADTFIVSSPFRGTQLVYTLGERTDALPAVRPFSVGSVLAKVVRVISYLAPILPKMLDLHAESRLLSFRDASLSSSWQRLCKSDWAEGKDATPYDATFHTAEERRAGCEGSPNGETFYRSYCASLTHTKQSEVGPQRAPAAAMFSPFYLTSLALAYFDFTKLRATPGPSASPADYREHYAEFGHPRGDPQSIVLEELRENAGVVPLFPQFHPFKCRWVDPLCGHYFGNETCGRIEPYPGIWDVSTLQDTSHLAILSMWRGPQRQQFCGDLGAWLYTVDCAHLDGSYHGEILELLTSEGDVELNECGRSENARTKGVSRCERKTR
ncbi:hypothetical protein BDN67DRAFT_900326 [Paxillus ammoniavirescens]|nr:hypothetical protein BDN67DRAFT_900326 [Paxillus ammoniavirescens]